MEPEPFPSIGDITADAVPKAAVVVDDVAQSVGALVTGSCRVGLEFGWAGLELFDVPREHQSRLLGITRKSERERPVDERSLIA